MSRNKETLGNSGRNPERDAHSFYGLDVSKSRVGSMGASASASSGQRHSILDPHDSVMDLLNRQQQYSSRDNSDAMRGSEKSNARKLTESWQAIERDDYSFFNTNMHNNSSQTAFNQQFGCVLSSDTSEEEIDGNSIHSPIISGPYQQQNNHFGSYSTTGISAADAAGYGDTYANMLNANNDISTYGQGTVGESTLTGTDDNKKKKRRKNSLTGNDESDEETITVSLGHSWAGSFFVMPKLSLSESMKRFKVLILSDTDSAKSFYNRLSRYYQSMFDVGKINEVGRDDAQRYTAFMIIFSDAKKVTNILNKMVQRFGSFNLIPICHKGQKQSVTESVKAFSISNKLKLMSYPVVISDHYEIHGLLRHLHSLYVEVDSDYETDVPRKSKARRSSKKKKLPFYRKRWIWPVSIAIGLGLGCCVSIYLGKLPNPFNRHTVDLVKSSDSDVDLLVDSIDNRSALTVQEKSGHSIPELFSQVYNLVRDTALQLNELLRQFIFANLNVVSSNWVQSIGKELLNPDSQSTVSKVTALDLVMF